jgi:hypothetical protein
VRLLSDDGLWKYFYQLLTLYPMAAKVLLQIFIKYEERGFNWLYQLLWMARKWFEHFESKMDFLFILLKKEIIEWRVLQTFLELDELAVNSLTKTW